MTHAHCGWDGGRRRVRWRCAQDEGRRPAFHARRVVTDSLLTVVVIFLVYVEVVMCGRTHLILVRAVFVINVVSRCLCSSYMFVSLCVRALVRRGARICIL